MSKRVAVTAVVLALAVAGAGIGYYVWTHSPRYALRQAAKAAEEHDLAKFKQYVDTERLTARFVDDMFATVTEQTADKGGLFSGLASGMLALMKPQLTNVARESLERGVETGEFEAAGKDKENPADAAKPYWRRAGENESGFRRISYVKEQGKIALAGLEMYDADLKTPFTVELKLRDAGSHWQVTEIANLPAVLQTLKSATEKRLAEINAPIRQELERTIRFESIDGSAEEGQWGFVRKASVRVRLQNTSQRPVDEVHFAVAFHSGSNVVGRIRCLHNGVIAPGESVEGTWSEDINPFLEDDMRLFDNIGKARAVPELERVRFAGGRVLEMRKSITGSSK
jgi:hypothetical protein